jgi:hypothetical protein
MSERNYLLKIQLLDIEPAIWLFFASLNSPKLQKEFPSPPVGNFIFTG